VLDAFVPAGGGRPRKPAKKHDFVKAWTMADLEPALPQVAKGRNFNRGKEAYEAAQCILCHKFGNEGGAVGPDLTAISSRFKSRDILESIIDPSKVISEQFQNTILDLKDGDTVDGRILEETADSVIIQPNPLQPEKLTVKKSDIKDRRPSKLSPMPQGLANILRKNEILDLLAYLESAGRKDAPMFAK
jgi:putative heme-binding domain-containing protein